MEILCALAFVCYIVLASGCVIGILQAKQNSEAAVWAFLCLLSIVGNFIWALNVFLRL